MLDTKHRVIRIKLVSIGSLDSTVVHPREVFREAAAAAAAAIILFHNHPSGDPKPSPDDFLLTARMVSAGHVMGIEVLDHLILADQMYYSMNESGRIRPGEPAGRKTADKMVGLKVLYFDCFAGAAGDMVLGALIDAGVALEDVRRALGSLAIAPATVWTERVTRTGISATKFCVRGEHAPLDHAHDHDGVRDHGTPSRPQSRTHARPRRAASPRASDAWPTSTG